MTPARIDPPESTVPGNVPEENTNEQKASGAGKVCEPLVRQRKNGTNIGAGKTADGLADRTAGDAAGVQVDGIDAVQGEEMRAAAGSALREGSEPAFKVPEKHSTNSAAGTTQGSTVELPRDAYFRILEKMLVSVDQVQLSVDAHAAKRLDMLNRFALINHCCSVISATLLVSPEFAHERQIQCSRQLEAVLRSADGDSERMAKIRIICNSHPVISIQLFENESSSHFDDPFGNPQTDKEVYARQADLLFAGILSSNPGKKIDLVLGPRIASPSGVINSLLRQVQMSGEKNRKPVVAFRAQTSREVVSEIDWKALKETIDLEALILRRSYVNHFNERKLAPLFQGNETLKYLDISSSCLSDSDVRSIIRAASEGASQLESFQCRAEKAYDTSVEKLGQWLSSNPSLKEVDVRTIGAGSGTVAGLFDCLATNTRLAELMIGPCELTDQVIDSLERSMEARSAPLELALYQNEQESMAVLSPESRQKLRNLASSGLRIRWDKN